MVKLTQQLSGVIITETDAPLSSEIRIKPDEKVTGYNASNKPWKVKRVRSKANELMGYKPSKEELDRKRKEQNELKALVKELKQRSIDDSIRHQKRREDKKKRQEANEANNMGYQVITDNKKISKWSKRARDKLMKMPKGLYEKYLAKSK